jgi:diacylglycerol kinase family enzyme
MRVILVHNPGAGDDDHSPKQLAAVIESAGHDVYRVMSRDEPLREELTGRVDLVVVAGGDGTVRKTFQHLAGRATPVTVVPLGTANNIARALGFDDEADAARLVSGWDGGEVKWYDLGTCYYGAEERAFVESAGAGLVAQVLVRAEDEKEPPGGDKIELGLRLLRTALHDPPVWSFRIEVDGRDVSADMLAVEVTNVPETGPRVPLDLHVDPGDGLFEAVLIDPGSREPLLAYVDARLGGQPAEAPRFEVHHGTRIALGLPQGAPFHLDDELVIEDAADDGIRAVAATPTSAVRVLVPA